MATCLNQVKDEQFYENGVGRAFQAEPTAGVKAGRRNKQQGGRKGQIPNSHLQQQVEQALTPGLGVWASGPGLGAAEGSPARRAVFRNGGVQGGKK